MSRLRRSLGGLAAWALAATGLMACGQGSAASNDDSLSAPTMVDETASAGLDHAYTGEFEFFVGGGVATFDCNGDGLAELYLAGGTAPAALYRNDSSVGGPLRFAPMPSPVTDLISVTGAYPLDVDSDDVADLVVLRRGSGNVLLRGLGDCSFEDATARFGLDGGEAWTAAFSATWESVSTLPTLAFGNYLVPGTTDCAPSALVRPMSADAYGAPIPLRPGYCTLSVLFSDWSRSGRRDLRLTNDRHYYRDGEDQLWRVVPGEAPREYTEADGWRPLRLWGMGIASYDVDGDGLPEVFLTSQGDNKLQTLESGDVDRPTYRDIALDSGVTAQRPYTGGDVLPSTAWHPEFDDVNNDGFVDLFITKGNVEAQPDYASRDPSNLFLGQADGTFVEGAEAAGIVDFDKSRGAALADLNLDGLLDLVVVHRRTDVRVWRNVGAGDAEQPEQMGHWLGLRLHQPAPNVDAVGAWIDVRVGDRVMSREVTVGGGHASGQLGWIHIGLGEAESAEVRVEWPDGDVGPWMAVGADQFATVERGATEVEPWLPEGRG
ncbi:MAG: CRTAC1 family protein [Ilumatobacteraceae bacterium]